MTNSQAFATELRQNVLDAIEFCRLLSADLRYTPDFYRVPNDIQALAAQHLHTVMGYRADQAEF